MVQFMVPDSLSVWVQRAGRAGRSGAPSAGVLLYESSVVQKVKGKGVEESDNEGDEGPGEQLWEGDDFKKKNVEGCLRSYVLTDQCRRAITDEYFGTPVRDIEGAVRFTASEHTPMGHLTDGKLLAYSVPCCDNCMRRANPERKFTHVTELLEFMLPALTIDEPIPQTDLANPSTKAAEGMGPRRTEWRAACCDFLTEWHIERWLENHADEVWGPEILLPDKVLTKLAATASLQTKEDIRSEVEGWWLWDRYSQEVLNGLKAIDLRFEAIRAAKEADRLEEQ